MSTTAAKATMAAWEAAICDKGIGAGQDLKTLVTPRAAIYRRLTSVGLPTAPYDLIHLETSGEALSRRLSALPGEQFYLLIEPEDAGSPDRFTGRGLSPPEVHLAIDGWRESHGTAFVAMVSSFAEVEFQGVIVCKKNGFLYGEFKKGAGTPITRGDTIPDLTFSRDRFTGCFRYSTDDPVLRSSIHRIMDYLPALRGERTEYLPGYFELSLTSCNRESFLRPIFTDYRTDPYFLS